MPNQNSPDPNTTNTNDAAPQPVGSSQPVSPVFPQSDLPPIPPDFSAPSVGDSGSAAPISSLPPIISPSPKKKFGGGRIIATILGLFLLIGGVGAGLLLTQQQQIFQPKAAYVEEAGGGVTIKQTPGQIKTGGATVINTKTGTQTNTKNNTETQKAVKNEQSKNTPTQTSGGGYDSCGECLQDTNYSACAAVGACESLPGNTPTQTSGGGNECSGTGSCTAGGKSGVCINGACISTTDTSCKTGDPGAPGCCVSEACDNPVCEGGQLGGRKECKLPSGQHCTIAVGPSSGCGGSGTGGGTTTTSSSPTASCQNIKAYSSTWALLTPAQLSTLAPATSINFCTTGVASEGIFDKAKFTINSVAQPETTTKRPGSTDYCQTYTISAGVSVFNVTAQIHHATLGWR